MPAQAALELRNWRRWKKALECRSYRFANAGQVFASEGLARYGGFRHQRLADAVVHVLLETALLARVLAETALGILGIDLLQASAARVVTRPHALHLRATENLPIAVRGEVHDPQIDPQHLCGSGRGRFQCFPALCHLQIVDASLSPTPPDQIGAAHRPGGVSQQRMLARPKEQAADHAPIQGVERDPIQTHQAVGAGIVAHAATWAKLLARLSAFGFDGLNRFHRLGPGTDRELRPKPKRARVSPYTRWWAVVVVIR